MDDCLCVQNETLILTAAGLGHQQVVETLIQGTADINTEDAEVGLIAIINFYFALLVTDTTRFVAVDSCSAGCDLLSLPPM